VITGLLLGDNSLLKAIFSYCRDFYNMKIILVQLILRKPQIRNGEFSLLLFIYIYMLTGDAIGKIGSVLCDPC
jgi:hypothetical protein